jgi:hypothetical protein
MAESQDLELKRRAAPEGGEKQRKRTDNTCPNRNRRVNSNPRIINKIGLADDHSE